MWPSQKLAGDKPWLKHRVSYPKGPKGVVLPGGKTGSAVFRFLRKVKLAAIVPPKGKAQRSCVVVDIKNMTVEEMQAEIARLSGANEALVAKQAARQHFTLKVSAKGALSAYGLGRFPVTLYRSQWESLLSHADQVRDFIKANEKTLKVKEPA